jgi:hypothetical protein
MRDFWISIAAGVALSVVSWVLFQVVAPFYRAWRYQAPSLAGQWSFFDVADQAAPAVGAGSFSQSGEDIEATITRTTSRKGKPLSRSFTYRGRVRDGQLLLTFQEPVSNGFIAGNLVLKVSGDLKSLAGYTVYLDRDSGQVVAHPIVFRKQ